MSTIPQKDRVSLCRYTFSDHRQCRTPRSPHHPHFCFYHARLESQSVSAAELADDIEYFFSGKYISANDLSRVLARIFAAIVRGDIKPRLAKTIVYLAQTFNQTIHLAQHEYINAFSTNAWREVVYNSVTQNFQHDHPPADQESDAEPAAPEDSALEDQPAEVKLPGVAADDEPTAKQVEDAHISPSEAPPSPIRHPERSEGPAFSSSAEAEVCEIDGTPRPDGEGSYSSSSAETESD